MLSFRPVFTANTQLPSLGIPCAVASELDLNSARSGAHLCLECGFLSTWQTVASARPIAPHPPPLGSRLQPPSAEDFFRLKPAASWPSHFGKTSQIL